MKYRSDVLILGAGAAGLMCAIEAGRRGRSVTVLEGSNRAGRKILISGGGRCNFTNLDCRPENFLSENQHFSKSALARYTPEDFLNLVARHGIGWQEKAPGQLFCERGAQQILTMLEEECVRAGVRVRLSAQVRKVDTCERFTVHTGADEYVAKSLVVATGGLSIPKMGATGLGYELAKQFGLKVVEPRPALVAFTLAGEDARRFCDLAGVSTEVEVSCGRQSFRDKLLITHRGFSGPAILQISSYWRPGMAVRLDFAPGQKVFERMIGIRAPQPTESQRLGMSATLSSTQQGEEIEQHTIFPYSPVGVEQVGPHGALLRRDETAAMGALRDVLPARLAERWLQLHPMRRWSNVALEEAEQALHNFEFVPAGTEGYAKAEVTAGGVDTDELSSKTMEAKQVPGLYFIGEVVDVTGWLGGYNFQWAWASGWCAGQNC